MKFIKSFEITSECRVAWEKVKRGEIKGFSMAISDDLATLVLQEIIENQGKTFILEIANIFLHY